MKLNLCSGGVNKEGFISIDMNPVCRPDILLDITKERLPYENCSIEEIWLMHGPEHLHRHHWDFVFMEVLRVLIPQGRLVLGYPEFKICAEKYIKAIKENDSKKEYWLQTIYGRRHWTGDEHVTACNSVELQLILESCGYYRVKFSPESVEDYYNTLLVAFKDPEPQFREKIMCEELGLQGEPKSIQELASEHLVPWPSSI